MKKSRWIKQAFILSVSLNALLLCIFFYFILRDQTIHFAYSPSVELKKTPPPLSMDLLHRLQIVPFGQLVDLLNDDRKVEYGYRVRDYALGALVSFHYFDVERGLGRGRLPQKKWEYEGIQLQLLPHLNEEDFHTLSSFARIEKWPLTTEGLFKQIQERGIGQSDSELICFFCHSKEFILVQTLFARAHVPIQRKTLLSLVLESGWEHLSHFCVHQHTSLDFSEMVRREFLTEAVAKKSPTAAHLLLLCDLEFVLKECEDAQLSQLIGLIDFTQKEALHFARKIMETPRDKTVKDQVVAALQASAGDSNDIAGHFVPKPVQKELRPRFRQTPPAAPDPSRHSVQSGESLWSIARKYKIPLERLIEVNHLKGTTIRTGTQLVIP